MTISWKWLVLILCRVSLSLCVTQRHWSPPSIERLISFLSVCVCVHFAFLSCLCRYRLCCSFTQFVPVVIGFCWIYHKKQITVLIWTMSLHWLCAINSLCILLKLPHNCVERIFSVRYDCSIFIGICIYVCLLVRVYFGRFASVDLKWCQQDDKKQNEVSFFDRTQPIFWLI